MGALVAITISLLVLFAVKELSTNRVDTGFMEMTGYTKLFGSIITSTIWRETNETRILWITMLALKNRDGFVEGSIPGLADMARLSLEDTLKALETLRSHDPYSRTKEHDGRRIEDVEGGWRVLNHDKYRDKMNADERREYFRVKQRESRAKRQTPVNKRQQKSKPSTHTDADTDTKTLKKNSVLLDDPLFAQEWIEFLKSRKAMKKPMTERAEELILARLAERPDQALTGLRTAIERGWQGFKWEWMEDRRGGATVPQKPQRQWKEV